MQGIFGKFVKLDMPRQPRINIPGEMYHVIARGIERSKIFCDNKDRKQFLQRMAILLEECEVVCYAWALLSNHFHLLVMPKKSSLTVFMHRLMTGYAVNFNIRHKRAGHLFQNRYKSILCQKESYFLELIRYIHLNPLRAGLVENLEELAKYPWCGHSTLLRNYKRSWQETKEIYLWFSPKRKIAMKKYLEFLEQGKNDDQNDLLQGGGLRRSAGGWHVLKVLLRDNGKRQSDERILGDGEYVDGILRKVNQCTGRESDLTWSKKDLLSFIYKKFKMGDQDLEFQRRGNNASVARSVYAYLGKVRVGMKSVEIAAKLNVSESAVCKMARRGEMYLRKNEIQ